MKKYIDKKLFLILLGYVFAYHIVFISKGVLLKYKGVGVFNTVTWKEITIDLIIGNSIIVPPIVVVILVVTKIMINKNYKWRYIIVTHFVFSLIFGFFIYLFGNLYQYVTKDAIFNVFDSDGIINMIYDSNVHFLGYVGFVSIIYSYYYINKTIKVEVQKAQLSEQLTHVKMDALKSQLNPHFLFNTLNSISALIIIDPKKAQEMITFLGDLFREVLLVKNENLIPLHKEISILNKYIDIMRIRFSDHLAIDIQISEDLKTVLIPSMIIQPIIENSFKHGYSYTIEKLKVKLHIFKKENELIITISNDGEALDTGKHTWGMGIKNIKDRLSALFNNDFDFIFRNRSDSKGVETLITIPLKYSIKN